MNFNTNAHVSANESKSSTRDYLSYGHPIKSVTNKLSGTMMNNITNSTSDLSG